MLQRLASLLMFVILFCLERGFIASLAFPFSTTPLIVASGVYVTQHAGLVDGVVWITLGGLTTDLLGLTRAPQGTLIAIATAAVAYLSSHKLFSNRSVYGVLACAATTVVAGSVFDLAWRLFLRVAYDRPQDWGMLLNQRMAGLLMTMVVVLILFRFSSRVRAITSALLRVDTRVRRS